PAVLPDLDHLGRDLNAVIKSAAKPPCCTYVTEEDPQSAKEKHTSTNAEGERREESVVPTVDARILRAVRMVEHGNTLPIFISCDPPLKLDPLRTDIEFH